MKYTIGVFVLTILLSFRSFEDIYSISIKTIDGEKIELSRFRGKKMFFILLPTSPKDTTVSIHDLSQLQAKYKNSLVIIGIPAEEYGFKKGEESKLKQLLKKDKKDTINFIIAEGMKVKKGNEQSSIFQWLTNKNKNLHFDQDVRGVGCKYFVNEIGQLYGVAGPQLKLSGRIIDRIISEQIRKQ